MCNYDHDVLGVGNLHHPANQEIDDVEIQEPETLREILDHLIENPEDENLRDLLILAKENLDQTKQDLIWVIKDLRIDPTSSQLNGYANELCKIRNSI